MCGIGVSTMFSSSNDDPLGEFRATVCRHIFKRKQGIEGAPLVCTLGKFDGLHQGHQLILERMREVREQTEGISVAMLLWPHPLTVLQGIKIPRIQSLREQIRFLSQYGIQNILLIRFTKELSLLSPDQFLETYLLNMLKVTHVIVGEDAAVGYQRKGDIEFLRVFFESRGIQFEVVKQKVCTEGAKIGSGSVRSSIELGDTDELLRQLGRYYSIEGRIIRGDRRGSKIGFPTANLHIHGQLLPKYGVYISVALLEGVEWPSVTNVGLRPTVDGKRESVETHILGFSNEELYGRRIRIGFVKKIRDEIKFKNLESLTQQIRQDVENAQAYFAQSREVTVHRLG